MGTQHGVPLGERPHSNLNEVGRIPSELQVGRRHRSHDVKTAARNVAVDIFLVLVRQDHVRTSGHLSQGAHAGEHLVTPTVRIGAFRNEEREDSDVRRFESLRDLHGVPHPLQVRWELIVDGDLADR